MTAREWKPGDVAMVTWCDEVPTSSVRIRVARGETDMLSAKRRDTWWGADGYLTDDVVTDVRPLVVIDPEDREQVERLLTAILSHQPRELVTGDRNVWNGQFVDALTRALREFANPTPPKPPEPTGLGAVVVDEHGCKWVLYTHPDSTAPWTDGSTSSEWSDLDAVRVLSEGVTE